MNCLSEPLDPESWNVRVLVADPGPADCRHRVSVQGFGSCAARFIDNFSFGQLQLETPIQKHRRESQQSSQTNLRSEPTQRRTRASASMRAKRSGETASCCKADLHTMSRARRAHLHGPHAIQCTRRPTQLYSREATPPQEPNPLARRRTGPCRDHCRGSGNGKSSCRTYLEVQPDVSHIYPTCNMNVSCVCI